MSWMMAYEDRTLVRTFARFFRSLHEATCCRGVSSQAGLRQMRASPALNRPRMHPGGRGSLCNPGKAAGPIVRAVGSGPYRHPTNGILLIHPPAQHAHRGTRNSRAKLEVAMARLVEETLAEEECIPGFVKVVQSVVATGDDIIVGCWSKASLAVIFHLFFPPSSFVQSFLMYDINRRG